MQSYFRKKYFNWVELPILQTLIGDCKNKIILEIGCGTGITTLSLFNYLKPQKIIAIDFDSRLIAKAKEKLDKQLTDKICFLHADVCQLTFPDNYFDAVIDTAALHHVDDWQQGLKEIHRVLKREGVFVFEEVTRQWLNKLLPRILFKHPKHNRFSSNEFLLAVMKTSLLIADKSFLTFQRCDFIFGRAVKTQFQLPEINMTCAACDKRIPESSILDVKWVRSNIMAFSHQVYPIWLCSDCKSVTSLFKVDLASIYSKYPLSKRRLDILARPAYSKLLSRLKNAGLKKHHRILDVGCGNGIFIQYLKQKGYKNVEGFDPYEEKFKLQPKGLFDVIIANDVIEHFDDPKEFMHISHQLLKDSGFVYTGTACTDNINFNFLENYSMLLHQPYHRFIFSTQQFYTFIEKNGGTIKIKYKRSYMDTLYPFANYRFLDELNFALESIMDNALNPIPMWLFIRYPSLFFFAFFGFFFPSTFEPAVIFVKRTEKDSCGPNRQSFIFF